MEKVLFTAIELKFQIVTLCLNETNVFKVLLSWIELQALKVIMAKNEINVLKVLPLWIELFFSNSSMVKE